MDPVKSQRADPNGQPFAFRVIAILRTTTKSGSMIKVYRLLIFGRSLFNIPSAFSLSICGFISSNVAVAGAREEHQRQ